MQKKTETTDCEALCEAARRVRWVGGYLSISQFGNACWSLFTPSSVTRVTERSNVWSCDSPSRCSKPASVTCVKERYNF